MIEAMAPRPALHWQQRRWYPGVARFGRTRTTRRPGCPCSQDRRGVGRTGPDGSDGGAEKLGEGQGVSRRESSRAPPCFLSGVAKCDGRAMERGTQVMPSLLLAATVPTTLRSFLLPLATHFVTRGWRVDGMACDIFGLSSVCGGVSKSMGCGLGSQPAGTA